MAIIGQPENYSDILERIFWSTLFVSFGCTAALASASPEVKALLQSVNVEAELGPVKGLKLLYVGLPTLVALASRAFKLHDRVSDLLGLRKIIDVEWILLPLARRVVVIDLDELSVGAIRFRRREALYRVFYPFVSLPESKIDAQLVRTALDNLGWLWVLVEALVLLLLTESVLLYLGATQLSLVIALVIVAAVLGSMLQWGVCRRSSSAEVDAILADKSRWSEIRDYFQSI